jgi:hypothetical protein
MLLKFNTKENLTKKDKWTGTGRHVARYCHTPTLPDGLNQPSPSTNVSAMTPIGNTIA